VYDSGAVALSKLQLVGGKFAAAGALNIDQKKNLNGHLTARLSAGTLQISAPLGIAGKLDAPEIRSGGARKAGSDEGFITAS
jgi:hypothetical protein